MVVTSACDAWAVGTYSGSTSLNTLILHWDGSSRNAQASPNVGTVSNLLTA